MTVMGISRTAQHKITKWIPQKTKTHSHHCCRTAIKTYKKVQSSHEVIVYCSFVWTIFMIITFLSLVTLYFKRNDLMYLFNTLNIYYTLSSIFIWLKIMAAADVVDVSSVFCKSFSIGFHMQDSNGCLSLMVMLGWLISGGQRGGWGFISSFLSTMKMLNVYKLNNIFIKLK